MNSQAHPARSPEFLSRLHDGELEPGERAQFESHRAHCSGCRAAAAEFETALAFYRSSRTTPASADLSARILRKLQTANQRRSPLGRSFGIDLRWAGAFAAALIAVIIGSSIISERENRRRLSSRETGPIAVVVEEKPRVPAEPDGSRRDIPAVDKLEDRVAAAAPAPRSNEKTVARRGSADSSGDEAEEVAAAPAPPPDSQAQTRPLSRDAERSKDAFNPAAASGRLDQQRKQSQKSVVSSEQPPAAAARPSGTADQPGGEGAVAQSSSPAEAPSVVRLRVIAAPDGQGTPPVPVNAETLALSGADRGEYLLLVKTDGSVTSVHRAEAKRKSLGGQFAAPRGSIDELMKLKFAAADRPRRVLVRVE